MGGEGGDGDEVDNADDDDEDDEDDDDEDDGVRQRVHPRLSNVPFLSSSCSPRQLLPEFK